MNAPHTRDLLFWISLPLWILTQEVVTPSRFHFLPALAPKTAVTAVLYHPARDTFLRPQHTVVCFRPNRDKLCTSRYTITIFHLIFRPRLSVASAHHALLEVLRNTTNFCFGLKLCSSLFSMGTKHRHSYYQYHLFFHQLPDWIPASHSYS
ncbi:hypothetical protein Plhal304r1_c005g0021951 [Plasmopara halstedii]